MKVADVYSYNVTLTICIRSTIPPSGSREALAKDLADFCQSLTPSEVKESIEFVVMVGDRQSRPLFAA